MDELLCSTRARCGSCLWWDAARGCRLLHALDTATGAPRVAVPAMQARLALA